MQSVELKFVFRDSEEKELEDLLNNLQSKMGGERKSYYASAGALDLVSYLEIVISFTAVVAVRPLLQKYFEGFFNADGLKKIGEDHREKIIKWFMKLEKDIHTITGVVQYNLNLLNSSFTFNGRERAIVIEIPSKRGIIYIVLNHAAISSSLAKNLPKGVISALRFLNETELPDEFRTFQLYFDKVTGEWPYLFMPSTEAFGRHIDYFCDLRDGKIKRIYSQSEFTHCFYPASADEYKFLVSPFRENDR